MNDKFFIDTNIFIYLVQHSSDKQIISRKIIYTGILKGSGIISTQVIQEFLNAVLVKIKTPMKPEEMQTIMQSFLFPLCHVYPDYDLFYDALEIRTETKYSFYDSLIISAALRGGCDVLYTENMQSGQKVRGVEIVNPYLPGIKLPQ